MEKISLHSLKINNFKGIKNFAFKPEGKDVTVTGTNATGKTTLKDALSWLFIGKDSNGKADFQLKPVDKNGDEIHKLEIEVEADIVTGSGDIVLKKRFYEKWVKTRGKAIKEFSGHTTDHFINGVPCPKKDFDKKIADMLDVDILPLISDTQAFNNLHWEKRRNILLDICGAITDADIVSASPEFKSLKAILDDSTISEHRKVLKAEQTEINRELDGIPARISENKNNIIVSERPKQDDYDTKMEAIAKKRAELAEAKSNEAASKKQMEINQIEVELSNLNHHYEMAVSKAEASATSELSIREADIKGQIITIEHDLINREKFIKTHKESLQSLTEIMDNKRAEWQVVFKTNSVIVDTCPTCEQPFPPSKIAEALEAIKLKKAKDLKAISEFGKEKQVEWTKIEKDLAQIIIDAHVVELDLFAKKQDLKDVEASLRDISIPVIKKPDTKKLDSRKEKLETEIEKLKTGSSEIEATINDQISLIETAIDLWKERQATFMATKKAAERVVELEYQEVSLAKRYEDLSKKLDLLDQFTIKKVELSEKQINEYFSMAKFKLFDVQINGGIKECCRTIYDGVPFNRGLNNGAKINVGLDIIDTLAEYYKFSMPVFIDNAESCVKIRKSKAQLIKLVVDEKVKTLTMKGE
ncbi:MAG: hypothetical protein DRH93_15585 [Deltaproteobacteria bacterium]|nr:MAG: hypothetical protein DRH93_15585 [Deltaproteobacteria bacterium]